MESGFISFFLISCLKEVGGASLSPAHMFTPDGWLVGPCILATVGCLTAVVVVDTKSARGRDLALTRCYMIGWRLERWLVQFFKQLYWTNRKCTKHKQINILHANIYVYVLFYEHLRGLFVKGKSLKYGLIWPAELFLKSMCERTEAETWEHFLWFPTWSIFNI